MHNASAQQLSSKWVRTPVWIALVLWYTRHKLANTQLIWNFWLTLVLPDRPEKYLKFFLMMNLAYLIWSFRNEYIWMIKYVFQNSNILQFSIV